MEPCARARCVCPSRAVIRCGCPHVVWWLLGAIRVHYAWFRLLLGGTAASTSDRADVACACAMLLRQVWPVIACMGIGGAWLGFVTSRFLFLSPDTHWSREDRGNMFRTNFAEGKNWTRHRKMFAKDGPTVADTSVIGMEAINRWVGGTSQGME